MEKKELLTEPKELKQLNKTLKMLLERRENIRKLQLPSQEDGFLQKIKTVFRT